jgi:hypothetical protein
MEDNRYALLPGYKWKNHKTDRVYTILFLATDSTNARAGSKVVVFERDGQKHVRDIEEFLIKFSFVSMGPVIVPA